MKSAAFSMVLLLVVVAPAQVGDKAQEQSEFGLEQRILHPVDLPTSVLEQLRADKRNRQSFAFCRKGNLEAIPASWFAAAEVVLKRDEFPGLVVKAENACLWGANIGPFWVFRHTPAGYEQVLAESALGLKILNTRTNGYRDIRLSAATARQLHTTVLKFRDGRYRVAAYRSEPIN